PLEHVDPFRDLGGLDRDLVEVLLLPVRRTGDERDPEDNKQASFPHARNIAPRPRRQPSGPDETQKPRRADLDPGPSLRATSTHSGAARRGSAWGYDARYSQAEGIGISQSCDRTGGHRETAVNRREPMAGSRPPALNENALARQWASERV